MITYKLTATDAIQRSDGAFIPPDPENLGYQAFLAWLEDGNTPEPADAAEQPESSPADRLAAIGLSVADLRALLDLD